MSQVQAISFDQVQCGKTVAETKKRFKWQFKIKGTTYLMQLVSSALSGKRIITLNSEQIYSQKNVLNIDFDFTHFIEGHIFRIKRTQQKINSYQMRIDNQSYMDILNNKKWGNSEKVQKKSMYKKQQTDPFSDFDNFASKNTQNNNKNDFGDFNFDDFSNFNSKPKQSSPVTTQNTAKPPQSNNIDIFDMNSKKVNNFQTVNFQTNSNFQTNNFDFAAAFKKNEQNLLGEQQFATNIYGKNNFYNQLMTNKPNQKSQNYGQKAVVEQKGFFDNFKIQMSGKQIINKVMKTVEQTKIKIIGNESLI